MNNKKVEIYGLYCPDTDVLKYIGKANDSAKRLKSHIRDSKTRNTPVYVWINHLIANGKIPKIKVICETYDWVSDEKRIISDSLKNGIVLLNVASGGNEPYCSKDVRAKNGKVVSNLIHSNKDLKRSWKLKKMIGHTLKYFQKNGLIDNYNNTVNMLQQKGVYL